MALASVEAYRLLVNEISSQHSIPKEVSLLDYAGFKIQALAQAKPVEWNEITKTLDFADMTWNSISVRITDAALRKEFTASLAGLRSAAVARDEPATLRSVTLELDLVDKLERSFALK